MTDASSPRPPQEPRLESWKEIASYLNRDARTVRRWEQSEGLPVHRHRHLTRSSVYAFPSELDSWRATRKPEDRIPDVRPMVAWQRSLALVSMMLAVLVTSSSGRSVSGPDQTAAMSATQVWGVPRDAANFVSDVSPDERYVSYMDEGNLAVYDVTTAKSRRLTTTGSQQAPQEFALVSAFDRRASRIAYAWFSGKAPSGHSLRVVDLSDGSEPRVIYQNQELAEIYPYDWTPDGQRIAIGLVRRDRTIQIGLISVSDGSLTVLKSMEWRLFGNMALSPDGRFLAVDLPENPDTGLRDVFVYAVDGSRGDIVAAGGRSREVLVGWSPDGGQLVFESDRTGSSAVWAVPMSEGRPTGAATMLKPDLGLMSTLGITASGRLFYVARALPRERLQLGAYDFATGKVTVTPADLPGNTAFTTHTPDFSPDGQYVAHLSVNYAFAGQLPMADSRITIRSLATGQVHRDLRPQPELELITQLKWAPDSRSLIAAGRNRRGRYGFYKIDADSGVLTTVVLDEPGPAVSISPLWAPDAKKLFFSRRFATPAPGSFAVFESELSGIEREIYRQSGRPSGWSAISPDGQYIVMSPAAGGRAAAGTNGLVRITTGDGATRELMPIATPSLVRVVAFAADSRSMSVVVLADGGQPELWRVPVDGSTPVRIGPFPFGEQIGSFRVHPDGLRIAIAKDDDGPAAADAVWRLDNFLPSARR